MSNTLGIMPTFLRWENDVEVTCKAIETYKKTCDADLVVIDDGSTQEELVSQLHGYCDEMGFHFCHKSQNKGFAKTVNKGIKKARINGQNALLVNADIEFFEDGWLQKMESNAADVVGALLIYPNGLVQHAGVYFSVIARRFDHIHRMSPRTLDLINKPRTCPVTGALMLIKNETIKKVGILDENFQMGFEDIDYCHEVFKAGLTCSYDPTVRAIHHESVFAKNDPTGIIGERGNASWEYLHQKHAGHDFSEYCPTMIWPDEL